MSDESIERRLELASFEVGANDVVLLSQAIRIATGERDLERAALLKIAEAAKVLEPYASEWLAQAEFHVDGAGFEEDRAVLELLRTTIAEWVSL